VDIGEERRVGTVDGVDGVVDGGVHDGTRAAEGHAGAAFGLERVHENLVPLHDDVGGR
jgi:hypothetical protein